MVWLSYLFICPDKSITLGQHGDPRCLLTRENLPVLHQLLPDDLPHDLRADAEQLGDGRVRVVEAVQQNLWHLSLLLPYQPVRISLSRSVSTWQTSPHEQTNIFLLQNLFCRNLRCFVAKSVLLRFTRFCVEKSWTKNCACGEKRQISGMEEYWGWLAWSQWIISLVSTLQSTLHLIKQCDEYWIFAS